MDTFYILTMLMGMSSGAAMPLWKTVLWFLKKCNIELLSEPASPLLDMSLKEFKIGTQATTCAYVHSSTHHNSQQVETIPMSIVREWINEWWYIHMMEYYSAMKRNEGLIRATTWLYLKNVVLKDARHKRSNIVWFHLYEIPRIGKPIEEKWGRGSG